MAGSVHNQPEDSSTYVTKRDLEEMLRQHSQAMIAQMTEQMRMMGMFSAPAAQPYLPRSSNGYYPAPRYPAPPAQQGYYQTPPAQPLYQPAPVLPYAPPQYIYQARRSYRPPRPKNNYRQAPPPVNYTNRAPSAPRQFWPLPMSYTEIFRQLSAKAKITPLPAHPNPNTSKRSYNPNASCICHSGQRGHDIESCFQFKAKVEDLVNSKVLEFTDDHPNIATNSLPNHSLVGAIFSESFMPASGTIRLTHLLKGECSGTTAEESLDDSYGLDKAFNEEITSKLAEVVQNSSVSMIEEGSTSAPPPYSVTNLDSWFEEVVYSELHPVK